MQRLGTRTLAVSALLAVGGIAVAVLALIDEIEWALAVLGLVTAASAIVVAVSAASTRASLQQANSTARATRREVRKSAVSSDVTRAISSTRDQVASLGTDLAVVRQSIEALRRQSATVAPAPAAPAPVESPVSDITDEPAVESAAPVVVAEPKTPLGLVGFFGHGNYGDELFVDVFQQHLGENFDIRIIPDLESQPYFSRPIEEKVDEVDAIVMGGGDLIQRWNTDPRYFDRTYLRKPFYLAGVGVPIYQGSDKHDEKPHIINRLRRFFNDPNMRMVGLRDDFSADWVREKLEPAAPVISEPDIVCSLELPPVQKPAGAPILGIVTRQRRVETPDDYSRLEELAAHAKSRGFRIRQIVLGTGSVGERDLANAPALDVPGKEVIHSENLEDLSRAIGECTVLASMKFHGTVVATMYGVPSIVLVPTNKNRNFMARIGREELVASHNSDRLIEIFGDRGPEPIAPESVEMLRARSTAFMERLRDQLIAETSTSSSR